MSFLIRSDAKEVNQVENSLIISEVAGDDLEEKREDTENVKKNPDNILEHAEAAKESLQCRYLFWLVVMIMTNVLSD